MLAKYVLTLDKFDGGAQSVWHTRLDENDLKTLLARLPLEIKLLLEFEYEKELLRLADDDIPF